MKCEKCHREASVHLTEVVNGHAVEKHLCKECALAENYTLTDPQVPVSQLLEALVGQVAGKEAAELKCEACGHTFKDFRNTGLLGCPNDYKVFEPLLLGLLERAQEGATHHVGKVPINAEEGEKRQKELVRLRQQLKEAVGREDYEQAARLRDQIKTLETA